MLGGWPCFFVSLGMIGLLTAIVGDLANIFGCLVGLKKSVTGNYMNEYWVVAIVYLNLLKYRI